MNGRDALIELLNGKKIRRSIWNNNAFWYLKNNQLHNENDIKFNMTFNELIIGDDWEIYDGFCDSIIAFDALKNGLKVKHKNWCDDFLVIQNNSVVNSKNNIANFTFDNISDKQWIILEE